MTKKKKKRTAEKERHLQKYKTQTRNNHQPSQPQHRPMKQRKIGKNKIPRRDESGTYYKDIVFVPSGSLSMNNNPTASTSSTHSREEDVNEIREVRRILSQFRPDYMSFRRMKTPFTTAPSLDTHTHILT